MLIMQKKASHRKRNAKKEHILIMCAHNDDQIIGAGGTLAKYAKEGKKVITVIFSYGEGSHPWLKRHITREIRLKEAEKANKVLGCTDVVYLGLSDDEFIDKLNEKIKGRIKAIIMKKKPSKIFTHAPDDPHSHHRAVHDITLEVLDAIRYKCDVYTYDIWNPIKVKKRDAPKLVVDISDTFRTKIKAFECHKSQKATFFSLIWYVYLQAFFRGLDNDVKYAEVFHKDR